MTRHDRTGGPAKARDPGLSLGDDPAQAAQENWISPDAARDGTPARYRFFMTKIMVTLRHEP